MLQIASDGSQAKTIKKLLNHAKSINIMMNPLDFVLVAESWLQTME